MWSLIHLIVLPAFGLLLPEPKSVRRRAAYVLIQSLGIGTSWSLLSGARSQTATGALSSEGSLSTLITLGVATSNLSVADGMGVLSLETLVLVDLVVESRGSDGTVGLENTQLLLVQDLRVGETLVNRTRAELRGANDLL